MPHDKASELNTIEAVFHLPAVDEHWMPWAECQRVMTWNAAHRRGTVCFMGADCHKLPSHLHKVQPYVMCNRTCSTEVAELGALSRAMSTNLLAYIGRSSDQHGPKFDVPPTTVLLHTCSHTTPYGAVWLDVWAASSTCSHARQAMYNRKMSRYTLERRVASSSHRSRNGSRRHRSDPDRDLCATATCRRNSSSAWSWPRAAWSRPVDSLPFHLIGSERSRP